jgi:hypothetical protein
MNTIGIIYIYLLLLSTAFLVFPETLKASSLDESYVDDVNQVGAQHSLAVPLQTEGDSPLLRQIYNISNTDSNTAFSSAPAKMGTQMSVQDMVNARKKLEVHEYLEGNSFKQNPILTDKSYAVILRAASTGDDPASTLLTSPCVVESDDLVDTKNLNNISKPLEELQDKHQFCGFSDRSIIGTLYSSIGFCACVKEKTQNSQNSQEALYKRVSDPETYQKALDIYRQSLVDKVMPGLVKDLEEMTALSTDFLSTDELSHLLYEVKADVKNDETRAVLQGMRQGMHRCSGLGMAKMISDMFNPRSNETSFCDAKSADFLLEGFLKATECNNGGCDNFRSFAESAKNNDKDSGGILSDFFTYKFSVNLIKDERILDAGFAELTSDEKFQKVVSTADDMTEFDPGGRPYIHPDYIAFERRLPTQEQLLFMHDFMEKKEGPDFNTKDFFKDKEELLDALVRRLSRNNLYRDNSIHNKFNTGSFSLKEKIYDLSQLTESLSLDKDRRIKSINDVRDYFGPETEKTELMRRLIINNYLYLGDRALQKCNETKRKVRKLCSSISGDGIALFSHPDFREKSRDMLVDEELQSKMAYLEGDQTKTRSPLADQMYCHANYSSMSSDCDEQASLQEGAGFSPTHCYYTSSWLMTEDYSGPADTGTGNTRSVHQALVSDAYKDTQVKSSHDFSSVVDSSDSDKISFKTDGEKLQKIPGFITRIKDREIFGSDRSFTDENIVPPSSRRLDNNQKVTSDIPRKEVNASKNINSSPQTKFLDGFDNLHVPRSQDKKNTAPAMRIPTGGDSTLSDTGDKQSGPRAQELRNQLKEAQTRQQSLQKKLDNVLNESNVSEGQVHSDKIKKKELQLGKLKNEINDLQKNIQVEKSSPQGQITAQGGRKVQSLRSPESSFSTKVNRSQAGKAEKNESRSGTRSPAALDSASSNSDNSDNSASQVTRSTSTSPSLIMNLRNGFTILPKTTDLKTAAKERSEEGYVLIDIGRPGQAEKIIFKYNVDGEALFDESGKPIILSREVVEVYEADDQEEKGAPGEEESALGEQEDVPVFRWSDVEDLLDNESL